MNILDCTLVNYKLKFQGSNYRKELHTTTKKLRNENHLTVKNSTLRGTGLKSTVSMDILKGFASFFKTSVSYVNQSVSAIIIEDKSEGLFNECSFLNNTILDYYEGSTIKINRSKASFINSNFTGNEGNLGGVVYINTSNVEIVGCIFERNEAVKEGGALYVIKNTSIDIKASIFRNIKAKKNGGVIYSNYSTTLTIFNTTFSQNKAVYENGGVLYMSNYTSSNIFESKFINNSAGKEGGVLFLASNNSLHINNSLFISNMAEINTGVLRAEDEVEIVLQNCTFRNNTATLTDSVITTYDNITMEINGCIFESNPSTGTGVIHGRQFVNILIIDSIFTKNSAIVYSMITIGLTTKLTVHSSMFSNNTGAGLFNAHDNGILKFIACNFTFHSLAADPLLYISNAELELLNSTFENNVQGKVGGVVLSDHSKINVTSCKFVGNKASKGGVFSATKSTIHVQKSTFVNNSAVDGGVAYLTGSTAIFSQTSVINSMATGHGGIISGLDSTKIRVKDSNFSFSSAIYGGCIYLETYSGLAAYNSRFENSLARSGGVIFKYGPGNVSLDNCILSNNNGTLGGAIYHDNSDYLRLSGGSCSYEPYDIRNCISFLCWPRTNCRATFYTYNYTMSNYQETVNSKHDRYFGHNITKYKMVFELPNWRGNPLCIT